MCCSAHKPGNKLYNLQALPTKKKALKLSWRDPITILTPHAVYNIKFEKDSQWVYANTSKKTCLVKHLKPGTTYKFFIKRDNQDNFETVSNSTRDEGEFFLFFFSAQGGNTHINTHNLFQYN